MKKTIKKQMTRAIIQVLICVATIIYTFLSDNLSTIIFVFAFFGMIDGGHRIHRNWGWYKNSDTLNNQELLEQVIQQLCYTGLCYIASRNKHTAQKVHETIINIMHKEYRKDYLLPLVTAAVEEARGDQFMGGHSHLDIRDFHKEISKSEISNLKRIWQGFAYNSDVRTPLIEQGYHEIAATIDGY